jgi:MFS transporter, DHA1 family, multidrug resistance protein
MTMPRHAEFVALIAALNMIAALAIDSMLPALPAIGASLAVLNENRWSLVITAFTIGFGIAQLFIGTLSDRFGRRRLLLVSLIAYAACSALAAFSSSFALLLLARAAQGAGAAGARVLAVSIVRDRFEGRAMAEVMSLASAIFMAAPIVAPFMGQAVLSVAPWRWIFILLALTGIVLMLWIGLRMPETLPREQRRTISVKSVLASGRIVLTDRQSLAYTIATTSLTVTVMGFLTSVQLIFSDIFQRPDLLPWGFGISAGCMMAASFVNSRVVMRFGMRRIGHGALLGMTGLAAVHAIVAWHGGDSLITWLILHAAMMACFSLAAGNFGAMAMEHMGAVAGTATSLQGSFSAIMGALGGAVIGQAFNGTTVPLYMGVTVAGLIGIAAILIAEGRLFMQQHRATQGA